jgi:hypothetical protein
MGSQLEGTNAREQLASLSQILETLPQITGWLPSFENIASLMMVHVGCMTVHKSLPMQPLLRVSRQRTA